MHPLYMSNKPYLSIFFLFICILIQNILHSDAKSTFEPISNEQGHQYSYSWIAQLIICPLGAIYNTTSLFLLLSLENRLSFYELNVALNVIDLLFALDRIYFATTYVTHGGLYYGRTFCEIEALWDIVLIAWSILVIVGISWVVRYDLCNNVKFSSANMTQYIIKSLLYALTLALISVFTVGVQLESSGTYCFLPFASITGFGSFLLFAIFVPISFLVYNAVLTYQSINRAQHILEIHGIKEQAKSHYIHLAKKLGFFFFTTVGCFLPAVAAALYEWTTGQYFPPHLSVLCALSALTLSNFINPTLFFYLNADLRDKFYEVFGKHIYAVFGVKQASKKVRLNITKKQDGISKRLADSIHLRVSKHNTVVPLSAANLSDIPIGSLSDKLHLSSAMQEQYSDYVFWLYDDRLSKVLKEHARHDYSMENFLFYEDAISYRDKGIAIMEMISKRMDVDEDNSEVNNFIPTLITEDIEREWKEFEQSANRLLTLYIKSPSAPLEINIPCDVRDSLTSILKKRQPLLIRDIMTSPRDSGHRKRSYIVDQEGLAEFVSLTTIDASKLVGVVGEYAHAFDQCIKVIHHIILSDIWPRFIKTDEFDQGIYDHQQQLLSSVI